MSDQEILDLALIKARDNGYEGELNMFSKEFAKAIWPADTYRYHMMKMVTQDNQIQYLKDFVIDTPNNKNLRDTYQLVLLGLDGHGDFLKSFAEAIVRSDGENFELLRPVAVKLYDKYKLWKIKLK